MKTRTRPPAEATIPNLAPMVDVVMVILIFFMLGTSFAVSEGALRGALPAEQSAGTGPGVSVIPAIRIELNARPGDETCAIGVMGRDVPGGFGALYDELDEKRRAGADAAARVLLISGADVRYQYVVSALDACQRAGFDNVQLMVGAEQPREQAR